MNLYLIRHGEVIKTHINRYVGSTDVGLSRNGKKQAERIKEYFTSIPFSVLYVSNLTRAKQTAKPLFLDKMLLFREDKRLAEIDLGPWEGKTKKQVTRMLPKDIACETITSGGELYADFVKRVKGFLADLKKRHPHDTVVIVTHKGVIREMYKQLLADDTLIVDQDYGCINQLVIDDKQVEVKMTNYLV